MRSTQHQKRILTGSTSENVGLRDGSNLAKFHSSYFTGYFKCLCCFLALDAAPISSQAVDVSTSSCPVFLSYQWGLQDIVKRLKSRIEESGIQCWMDIGQMGGGDALFSKIDAGIRGCKVTLLV